MARRLGTGGRGVGIGASPPRAHQLGADAADAALVPVPVTAPTAGRVDTSSPSLVIKPDLSEDGSVTPKPNTHRSASVKAPEAAPEGTAPRTRAPRPSSQLERAPDGNGGDAAESTRVSHARQGMERSAAAALAATHMRSGGGGGDVSVAADVAAQATLPSSAQALKHAAGSAKTSDPSSSPAERADDVPAPGEHMRTTADIREKIAVMRQSKMAGRGCVGWHSTSDCNPLGPRHSEGDASCKQLVSTGSGYCQCEGGVATKLMTCRCDMCMAFANFPNIGPHHTRHTANRFLT